MVKQVTRAHLHDRMSSLTEQQLKQKSLIACRLLCDTPEFEHASVMMLYLSLPKEVDTTHVFEMAFNRNKTVLVPRAVWETRSLIPVTISSLDCEMMQNGYGLRYPSRANL